MKKYRLIYSAIFLVLFFLTGCSRNIEQVSKSAIYFDTIITVTLYDTDNYELIDDCFALAETYENMLSKTVETSDVYKINHSNGSPTVVDEETIYLLEKALDYAAMTEGAIDPTILPLSDLWNFGENETVPNAADISLALSYVGYETITIDKDTNTITLENPNAGIDLGFIAKGYIADKMKEYLLSQGVESALINLGGNILCVGTHTDGSDFVLGIQEPFEENPTNMPLVNINDQSLVSSGVYERCFFEDGVLYHHILDTSTGYPVNNGLWSVTILSESSMEGDAYSTICMCLGLDDAKELIEKTDGLEALFITDEKELIYTSGFPQYLK